MKRKALVCISAFSIACIFIVCLLNVFYNLKYSNNRTNDGTNIPKDIGPYYVRVKYNSDYMPEEVYSIQIDDDILVFCPRYFENKRINYSVYTSWDELVFEDSVTLKPGGFEKEIGNQVLKIVTPSIPMVMINADKEEYKQFKEQIDTEYDKDIVLDVNTYVFEDTNEALLGGKASIHLRGNGSSVGFTKPYSLKFNESLPILNGRKAKKYNLLANWQDKSVLKNQVFFSLAKDMGLEYTPECKNVLLYINGNIQGIYTLTSKINVSKSTVNLGAGDFLVNWGTDDSEHVLDYDSEYWYEVDGGDKYTCYDVCYPEDKSTDEFINQKINLFVETLEGRNGQKLSDIIDIESFVKYYWVMEASMDFDAGYGVYSYYKASSDKIYMGPVWDMDLALGANGSKTGISFEDCIGWKTRELGFWKPFFDDDEFRTAVENYYPIAREKIFSSLSYYEDEADKISFEGEVNFTLKRSEQETYGIAYNAESYEEQVEKSCEWYRKRIEWIDNQMSGQ